MGKVIFEDRKRVEEIANGVDLDCYHSILDTCDECIINHFDIEGYGTCEEIAKALLELIDNQE